MAKILVAGNVFVIQSDIQLEKLRKLEKYQPDALKIFDDNGSILFAVGTGSASISKIGISFSEASHDEKKLACVTQPIPTGTEDVKSYIADRIGHSFLNLQKIEAGIGNALIQVEKDLQAIMSSISLVTSEEITVATSNLARIQTEGGEQDDD